MAAFCAFLCGHPSFAADKSGVSPNTISLPKGPGSIEGLGVSTLPPSTFGYVVSNPPDSLSAAGREILSLREPLQLMDSTNVDLVDLNADGLPDILRTIPGGNPQQAYLNLGPTNASGSTFLQWTNSGQMTGDTRAASYTLSQSYVHLADLDGDGLADLVSQPTASTIYFFQNLGNRSWGNRRTFPNRRVSRLELRDGERGGNGKGNGTQNRAGQCVGTTANPRSGTVGEGFGRVFPRHDQTRRRPTDEPDGGRPETGQSSGATARQWLAWADRRLPKSAARV